MPDILNLRKKTNPLSPAGEHRPSVPAQPQKKNPPLRRKEEQPHRQEKTTASPFAWTALPAGETADRRIFWAVLALVLAGGIFVIIQKDILFAILLFVFAAVIFILGKEQRHPVSASADESGITVNGRRYYFRSIKSFWIFYEPGGMKELSIELKRWYMPYLRIPLAEQNPLPLRHLLIRYLPEREHILSAIEIFLNGRS